MPRDKIAILRGARSAHGSAAKAERGRTFEPVGLGALLERVLSSFATLRSPSAAELFRRADRLRHEGRYPEATRLVEEGLRRAPTSAAGHLLAGYLHLAAREVGPAREAFQSALARRSRSSAGAARPGEDRDRGWRSGYRAARPCAGPPLPPRLPRGAGARGDARKLGRGSRRFHGRTGRAKSDGARQLPGDGRDPILARLDGTVVFAQCDEGKEPVLAQHVIQVVRIASATLGRAGLGHLRRAVIEGAQASTYLQTRHRPRAGAHAAVRHVCCRRPR